MPLNPKKLRQRQMGKIYLFVNIAAFTLFMVFANISNNDQEAHRRPSSKLTKEQKLALKKRLSHADRHTEKLASPLKVEIEEHPETKGKSTGILKYIGHISVSQNIKQADILWSLPKEVHLISGQKQQTAYDLKPGQIFKTEIAISVEKSLIYRLHLKAGVSLGSARYSSSAHHQTLWQKEVNLSKKELLKRSNEYIDKHQKQKIFK